MKHVEKKLTKKQLTSVILAAALVVIIGVSIPVGIVLANKDDTVTTEPPEIMEGEALMGGLTLAYPSIDEKSQLNQIEIVNSTGTFGFAKLDGEKHFTMYYLDSNGEPQPYYPKIYIEDTTVNYNDFFAIETSDGFSMYPKLDYLCLALQTPYFSERIILSEDSETRERQLKSYGLSEGEYSTAYFEYTDAESGEAKKMVVRIGKTGISGGGYYFTVGDRPYVYLSSNNYFNYAVSDFTVFLKALLVAPGLTDDKGFGPYLTPAYYQYKNELHKTEGEEVTEDSKVIVYTDIISTSVKDDAAFGGYDRVTDTIEIDLKKYEESIHYKRMINALTGAKIGEQTPKIFFTVTANSNSIEFGDAETKSYQYTVSAVEAILTDSAEITTSGASCGDTSNLIKVSYTASADGTALSQHTLHAVIDLSSEALPEEAEAALRAAPIGTLAAPVSFTVNYTKENSTSISGKYVITEIISVYNANGKNASKVTETSVVGYRYAIVASGKTLFEDTFVLDLAEVTDETDIAIKNALIGKGVSRNLNIEFGDATEYSECFMNFSSYEVSRIDYFVTSECVTAFRFQNSSKRDPYYGESLYENLMTDEHKLYGLNSSVCEQVVKILGGMSDESSSATAAGLTGDKVIAVGLTPEVMEKYGLYAYTIYFELPRSIYAYSNDNSDSDSLYEEIDDYSYYSTLAFNLYISEVDYETNTRYIASDMYDIVTRVNADDFVFLKYDFETFWARRYLVMMDIEDIKNINVEFNMSDIKGSYNFELIYEIVSYQSSQDSEFQKFNKLTVSVEPSDKTQPNKLNEYMNEKGYEKNLSLTELYEAIYGKDDPEYKETYPESVGTAYFEEAVKMLYGITYVDILPDSERGAALDTAKMLMKMTFEIKGSAYEYVYEFYRIDDRRIVVSIYKADFDGVPVTTAVSDFYISSFAFKKIVSNLNGLLNGEKINPDAPYAD